MSVSRYRSPESQRAILLNAWFFLTVTLAALLMGTSFSHVLQAPAKLRYGGPEWLHAQQTLYGMYATVGGVVEIGAIVSAAVLAYLLLKDHRPGSLLAVLGALLLATAFFLVWLIFTRAVNAETAAWTAQTLPVDWMHWRLQWEASHVARFILHAAGFGALLAALLRALSR